MDPKFELTDNYLQVIEMLKTAMEEGRISCIPAIHKTTGKQHAILCTIEVLEEDDESEVSALIALADIFPYDKLNGVLDEYEFPFEELDEEDVPTRMNFTTTPQKSSGPLTKLKNWLLWKWLTGFVLATALAGNVYGQGRGRGYSSSGSRYISRSAQPYKSPAQKLPFRLDRPAPVGYNSHYGYASGFSNWTGSQQPIYYQNRSVKK